MLNFCLVSAARHMVTDNDNSTKCRSKFKAPSLKTNTKIERPSENMGFSNNRLKISDQKFKISNLGIREQNEGTTRPQRQQMEMNLVTRKK